MASILRDHVHISEREPDGSWEDCTWDSGLEWYRLTYDATRPATHEEAQKLRRASGRGPTGGSNLGDLAKAIRTRYGPVIPDRITGFNRLKDALTPGKAAVVQGSMKAFGPRHRLSRWQPTFDGDHAVLIINVDGVLLWCDPLAPAKARVPVVVWWGEVKRYVDAFAGQSVVAPLKHPLAEPSLVIEELKADNEELAAESDALQAVIDEQAATIATLKTEAAVADNARNSLKAFIA